MNCPTLLTVISIIFSYHNYNYTNYAKSRSRWWIDRIEEVVGSSFHRIFEYFEMLFEMTVRFHWEVLLCTPIELHFRQHPPECGGCRCKFIKIFHLRKSSHINKSATATSLFSSDPHCNKSQNTKTRNTMFSSSSSFAPEAKSFTAQEERFNENWR